MPKSAKRNVTVPAVASSGSTPAKPGKASKRNVKTLGKSHTAALAVPVISRNDNSHLIVATPADMPTVSAPPVNTTDIATPMPRGLTRDAAGIVAARTNFAQYSDRDSAYLHFLGTACRANSGSATLRQIHDLGVTRSGMPDRKRYNPHYSGSGKATDIGAINRLIADGYFSRSADGHTITATAKALANAIYLGTR